MFLQIIVNNVSTNYDYYFDDQATVNDICFLFLSKSTFLKSKYIHFLTRNDYQRNEEGNTLQSCVSMESFIVTTVQKVMSKGPWLIVLVNLVYIHSMFMLHCPSAWLWVSILKNPDAPSKRWEEDRWFGYYVALFKVQTYKFSWHDQSRPPCMEGWLLVMLTSQMC